MGPTTNQVDLILDPAGPSPPAGTFAGVVELDDDGGALARAGDGGGALLLVAWLRGSGAYEYDRRRPAILAANEP